MLNAEYVDRLIDVDQAPDGGFLQAKWLTHVINAASATDALRERGYTIATIPTAFTSTAIESADEYLSDGRLSELEVRLVTVSPWATIFRDPVLDWLRQEQADGVATTLQKVSELAASPQSSSLRFVLAHVPSPHTPFVLHPEGTEGPDVLGCLPSCGFWNATIDELDIDFATYREGLRLQIEELNTLVTNTVREVVEADPEAVVVIMSDHGIRYSLDDIPEHYRIFLAAREPGGSQLFRADESPVNILRVLLAYLGEDISPLGYEQWHSSWWEYLELTLATKDR
jgi:hypothetical protein